MVRILKNVGQLKLFVAVLLIANFSVQGSSPFSTAKDSTVKKYLTLKEYDRWEFVTGVKVPKKGDWVGVVTISGGIDFKTKLTNLKSKIDTTINNTRGVIFSANGEWAILNKSLPGSELKKRKKGDKNLPNDILLLNLSNMTSVTIGDVNKFEFSSSGNFLVYKKIKGEENILILRDLKSGKEIVWGNVDLFSLNEKSEQLVFSLKSKDKEANSLLLYNPSEESITVLDKHKVDYSMFKWVNEGKQLVALKSVADSIYVENTSEILLWENIAKSKVPKIFRQNMAENFPESSRLTGEKIKVSKDGSRVFFEISFRTLKQKEKVDLEDIPEVEIWNSRDEMLISEQKASNRKSSLKSKQAVWYVASGKMVLIEDELTEKVDILPDNSTLVGLDRTPYQFQRWFGRNYEDVYSVDVVTGERRKLLENIAISFELDPSGRFFIYLADNTLYLYDIKAQSSKNITQSVDAQFLDRDSDYPRPYFTPYGFAGWVKDGKSCLIYSEFDIWQLFVDGRIRRITKGKEFGITYRLAQKIEAKKTVDPKDPLIYSMFDRNTKSSGLAIGKIGDEVKVVVYEPASVNYRDYSKENQHLIFSKSTFQDPADIYIADIKMNSITKVTSLNEFQKNYYWGKAELVEYSDYAGKKLKGVLYYPVNYQKGKKYPMITNVYEKQSDMLNSYITPLKSSYYNFVLWMNSGYFIFCPDIEFEAGNPGISATRTLENAVASIIEKGDVDKGKVGLIGHSWGGYLAAFVPTQTNIFAASVSGAGLTDLVGMYLAVTSAFKGAPENNHFEVNQERMKVAPWMAPLSYLNNSPVMQIDKLNTPILLEVGDNDANVNWSQGIAYYNAARRAGKDLTMLVYAKEGHNFSSEKSSLDYRQRIMDWFGYYLKGESAPDWITRSIPYNQQQELLKNKGVKNALKK